MLYCSFFLIRSRGPECQTPLTDLKILQLEFHHYLNFAEGCLLLQLPLFQSNVIFHIGNYTTIGGKS